MPKNTLNLTLSLDTDTIAAFKAEAADHTSEQALANHIITTRYQKPEWPDRAENAALAAELHRVEGERDRARGSAILHSNSFDALAEQIIASIGMRDIIANRNALREFRALGVNL